MNDRIVYEIDVEPDEGFMLSTGREWSGFRVRYRPLRAQKSGRWRSFVLIDQDEEPSIEQLQELCHRYSRRIA